MDSESELDTIVLFWQTLISFILFSGERCVGGLSQNQQIT